MMKILYKIQKHLPLLIVIIVACWIAVASYEPNTFLSGWDTLHPEFNLKLYAERIFFGAWQEHQGLGAPASQAHPAELARFPLLVLLRVFLPTSIVRYSFFFLMYVAGGLGIYLFIVNRWFLKKSRRAHWAASFGALLYLMNLGTLQHFYVPLEMFAVLYAGIGFLLLTVDQVICHGTKSDYFWLAVISVLLGPSAHTATLFYMSIGVVLIAAFIRALTQFAVLKSIKRVVLIGILILITNAYWIGPNAYYILAHSDYVKNAKISRHFSSEAFWQNQAFGNVGDVIILKNFLFHWKDYNFEKGRFIDLFDEWNHHLEHGLGYSFIYIVAGMYLIGIVIALSNKNKRSLTFSILVILLTSFFFLNNLNFPSKWLFGILLDSSKTFKEALRFPFTKFSILYMATMAIFFSETIYWITTFFSNLPNIKQRKFFTKGTYLVVLILLFYPFLLAFKGNLISNSMKVTYPSYYEEMFNWFNELPKERRIVKFPITDFWGWTYHTWLTNDLNQGYQGAGFIWFGLPQPIMDREFDRWVSTNEDFYQQISTALYASNKDQFLQVLDKYDITYLLYDNSAITTSGISIDIYRNQFLQILADPSIFTKVKSFGEVDIYQYNFATENWLNSSQTAIISSTSVDPYSTLKNDIIYEENGNYIESDTANFTYPLLQLTDSKTEAYSPEQNTITTTLAESGYLNIPAWNKKNTTVPIDIYGRFLDDQTLEIHAVSVLPTIQLGDVNIQLSDYAHAQSFTETIKLDAISDNYMLKFGDRFIVFPYTNERVFLGSFYGSMVDSTTLPIYSYDNILQFEFLSNLNSLNIHDCSTENNNTGVNYQAIENGISLLSQRAVGCASDVTFKSLPSAGLLSLNFDYSSNTPDTDTSICIFEENKNGCLNNENLYQHQATSAFQTFHRIETINSATMFNVSFQLRATDQQKQLSYSNATAEFFPKIGEVFITPSQINSLISRNLVISVSQGENITVQQPLGVERELSQVIDLTTYPDISNCSDQGVVAAKNVEEGIQYTSKDQGTACEYFRFDLVNPRQDFILNVGSHNVSGQALKLRIGEPERQDPFLEEITSENNDNSLYPILGNRSSDILEVITQSWSYGSIETNNTLTSLVLQPLPLSWISHFSISSGQATTLHPIKIKTSIRKHNYLYKTEVITSNQPGVISLSQSFDSAWLAFARPKEALWWNIQSYIQLHHYRYNGWANAWEVPAGDEEEVVVTILYWPQLLEFGGFILLIGTISYLGYATWKNDNFTNINQPKKALILQTKTKKRLRGEE